MLRGRDMLPRGHLDALGHCPLPPPGLSHDAPGRRQPCWRRGPGAVNLGRGSRRWRLGRTGSAPAWEGRRAECADALAVKTVISARQSMPSTGRRLSQVRGAGRVLQPGGTRASTQEAHSLRRAPRPGRSRTAREGTSRPKQERGRCLLHAPSRKLAARP